MSDQEFVSRACFHYICTKDLENKGYNVIAVKIDEEKVGEVGVYIKEAGTSCIFNINSLTQ